MAALDPDEILLSLCKILNPHVNVKLWEETPAGDKPVPGIENREVAADFAEIAAKGPEGKRELKAIRNEIVQAIKELGFNCTLGTSALELGTFGTTLAELRDYVIAISSLLK
jgi:hypothetical protein